MLPLWIAVFFYTSYSFFEEAGCSLKQLQGLVLKYCRIIIEDEAFHSNDLKSLMQSITYGLLHRLNQKYFGNQMQYA
jgi:hypothetical protein